MIDERITKLFQDVHPPEPPVYDVFGRRPLNLFPQIDDQFMQILESMSRLIGFHYKNPKRQEDFCWGFYGNTDDKAVELAQLLASMLRLPYVEITINPDTDLQTLISYRALIDTGAGEYKSAVVFGEIAQGLLLGSVVCVRGLTNISEGMQLGLVPLLEGKIQSVGPEGSDHLIHPASLLIATWVIDSTKQLDEKVRSRLTSFSIDS